MSKSRNGDPGFEITVPSQDLPAKILAIGHHTKKSAKDSPCQGRFCVRGNAAGTILDVRAARYPAYYQGFPNDPENENATMGNPNDGVYFSCMPGGNYVSEGVGEDDPQDNNNRVVVWVLFAGVSQWQVNFVDFMGVCDDECDC